LGHDFDGKVFTSHILYWYNLQKLTRRLFSWEKLISPFFSSIFEFLFDDNILWFKKLRELSTFFSDPGDLTQLIAIGIQNLLINL